jgi:uncharacterized membrane protein
MADPAIKWLNRAAVAYFSILFLLIAMPFSSDWFNYIEPHIMGLPFFLAMIVVYVILNIAGLWALYLIEAGIARAKAAKTREGKR